MGSDRRQVLRQRDGVPDHPEPSIMYGGVERNGDRPFIDEG
jgi:hypothetical protein